MELPESPSLSEEVALMGSSDYLEAVEELQAVANLPDGEVGDLTQGMELFVLSKLRQESFSDVAKEVAELLKNRKMGTEAMELLVQRLSLQAVICDVQGRKKFVDYRQPEEIKKEIEDWVDEKIFSWGDGMPLELKELEYDFAEKFGWVLTGHPTYSLSERYLQIQHELMSGHDAEGNRINVDQMAQLLDEVLQSKIGPDKNLNLDFEHKLSLEACSSIRKALHWIYGVVIRRLADFYPVEVWSQFQPKMVTLANWIWGDTDGRGDVMPVDSFMGFVERKVKFLEDSKQFLVQHLEGSELFQEIDHDYEILSGLYAEGKEAILAEIAKGDQSRFMKCNVSPRQLELKVAQLIEELRDAGNEEALIDAMLFRADLQNMGLMAARVHFRTNSDNVMDAADGVRGELVDLQNQPNTRAEDLLQVIGHLVRFIDADTPVRYLIAETRTEDPVLKLRELVEKHGLLDVVQISPLFEDRIGLEGAYQSVENMREDEKYDEYTEKKNEAAFQAGRSDSGRFVGQLASSLLLEQTAEGAQHHFGPRKVINFPTGGMSPGRGMHPRSLRDGLKMGVPPRVRNLSRGPVVWEEALQGGDALKLIHGEMMARVTTWRAMEEMYRSPTVEEMDDPFYDEEFAEFREDLIESVADFHQELMDDPAYVELLCLFGTMGPKYGSRKVKRSVDSEGNNGKERSGLSKFRAIGHNARLHMLAMFLTSFGGIGKAAVEIEGFDQKFVFLVENSPRFRRLIDHACCGFDFSDLEVFQAKVELVNPENVRSLELKALLEGEKKYDLVASAYQKIIAEYEAAKSVFKRFQSIVGEWESAISPGAFDVIRVAHCLNTGLLDYLQQFAAENQEFLEPGDVQRVMRLEFDVVVKDLPEFGGEKSMLDDLSGKIIESDPAARKGEIYAELERVFDLIERLTSIVNAAYNWMG